MKNVCKIFALIMTVAVVFTLGTLFTSAADLEPVGNVFATWDDSAADKITFDGDISDWGDAGYQFRVLEAKNFAVFPGRAPIPEDFKINAYFVADSDYLYVAFFIKDSTLVKGTDVSDTNSGIHASSYAGDAFQIAVDFNCAMENDLTTGANDFGNNKNIFYSFGFEEENVDFYMVRQESFNDAVIDEISTDGGVKGATGNYDGGWCAEFALSWDMLYQDFCNKTEIDPGDYVAAFNADDNFRLGVSLCYLDRFEPFVNDTVSGSTYSGWGTFDSDNSKWLPTDNGMYINVQWEDGRVINTDGVGLVGTSSNLVAPDIDPDDIPVDPGDDDTPEDTKPVDPDDTGSAPADEESSVADDTTEEAETTTAAATTKAPDADEDEEAEGCGSVVGAGAAVMVLTAAAAAVVLKKKN